VDADDEEASRGPKKKKTAEKSTAEKQPVSWGRGKEGYT
jgi:hypothetical protein